MLSEAVADCPICERPVRRCDPRRLVDDQLVHVVCAAAAERGRAASPSRESDGVTASKISAPIPRIALTLPEAAAALALELDRGTQA
jgi:hypothetical protein